MDVQSSTHSLYRTMHQLLKDGKPLVLASIVSQQGSGPRHIGTQMAITAEQCLGTIGGSLLEAGVVEKAKLVLQSQRPCFIDFDLDNRTPGVPGMICGGKARVFLDYVDPTPENQTFLRAAGDAMQTAPRFFVLTQFEAAADGLKVVGRAIVYTDGRIAGTLSLGDKDISALRKEIHSLSGTSILPFQSSTLIIEAHERLYTLFCFGAGHVAMPTAHIAALVGFRVVVLDDRAEWANPGRFPEADTVEVIPDFGQSFAHLDVGPDSYIAIFTRGHQFDRTVLEQALKTPAGYIGMISSKHKRDTVFAALRQNGVNDSELARVHSPIGIDIGAETPEEIAVSIVAELIRVRSQRSS